MKRQKYTVTDGKLVLTLTPFSEGNGFMVTSPFDPALITEAKTVPAAFEMARDALNLLQKTRKKIAREEGRKKRVAG